MSRREALELPGLTAAAAAMPGTTGAQSTPPKGAVIRTLLKDYGPEELATGATLFHEHMSLPPDFNDRFLAAAAAARAANGLPPLPARAGGPPATPGPDPMRHVSLMAEELARAKREGTACIVDAGHPDMEPDLEFVRQPSMTSGVPVVAGAGFYAQPFYSPEVATMNEEQLADALIRQCDDDSAGVFGEIGPRNELRRIMVDNPRRFLAFVPKRRRRR